MADMRRTRTERNLLAAFAGECQASVRYGFFAKQAIKEGFQQIGAIFQETSDQERVHARRMHKLMDSLEAEVSLTLRAAGVGATLDNLLRAAEGEKLVGSEAYPAYAAAAREEGFAEAALVFENIALAERMHMERYAALAANIKSGRVFRRDEPVHWRCRHCGWATKGPAAPERCPACDHPRAYFEILPSNW